MLDGLPVSIPAEGVNAGVSGSYHKAWKVKACRQPEISLDELGIHLRLLDGIPFVETAGGGSVHARSLQELGRPRPQNRL